MFSDSFSKISPFKTTNRKMFFVIQVMQSKLHPDDGLLELTGIELFIIK